MQNTFYNPIPVLNPISLIDLWSEDTWCGHYSEEYYPEKDTVERIDLLVQSFKTTAFRKGFGCEHVLQFHCLPSLSLKGHELRFINSENKAISLLVKISMLSASASVEEGQCPQNTSVTMHIEGYNVDTGKPFTFHVNVFRFPNKRITTYLIDRHHMLQCNK